MIKSIEMINFLSHSNTKIDFTDGLNVFVGRNGAGKSSVIDAINYALYSKHSRNDIKNLIKRGENAANIKVTFTVQNRTFRAERKLAKNNTTISVLYEIKDNTETKLVEGERRQFEESMTQEIEKLIGLNYDKMSIASIIEQGRIMDVITAKPKEFKELVNSIIDIDKLDDISLKLREDIKQFIKNRKDEYGYLPEDMPHIHQDIKDKQQNNESLTYDIQTSHDHLKDIQSQINDTNTKISEHNKHQEKIDLLNNTRSQYDKYIEQKISDIQGTISNDKQTIQDIIQKSKENLVKITSEISAVQDNIQKIRNMRDQRESDIKESIKSIQSQIDMYNDIKQKLSENHISDQDIINNQKQLENIQSQIDQTNNNITSMKERLGISDKLQITDGKCPLCNSTVNKLVDIFDPAELVANIQKSNHTIQELDSKRSEISSILTKLEETHRQNEIYQDRIKDMNDDTITQLYNTIKQKQQELEETDTSTEMQLLSSISEKQKSIESDGMSISDKQKIADLESKIQSNSTLLENYTDDFADSLKTRISQLELEIADYEIHDITSLQDTLNDLEQNMNDTNNDIGAMNERLRNNSEQISKYTDILPKLDKLDRFIQYIQNINDKVYSRDSPVAKSLRYWALQMISNQASNYISDINNNLSKIEIKEDTRKVSITCKQKGKNLDIKSLSGGEKISIALAIRLAMSHLLGTVGTNLMILDEPTIYLDETAKESFVDILNKLTRIQNRSRTQFIIITHDTEIFDNSKVDKIVEFEKIGDSTVIFQRR